MFSKKDFAIVSNLLAEQISYSAKLSTNKFYNLGAWLIRMYECTDWSGLWLLMCEKKVFFLCGSDIDVSKIMAHHENMPI